MEEKWSKRECLDCEKEREGEKKPTASSIPKIKEKIIWKGGLKRGHPQARKPWSPSPGKEKKARSLLFSRVSVGGERRKREVDGGYPSC